MKQLFQNILAKAGSDQIDFNYFIKFALNDQISWEVLSVFLEDFTSDLSKSKDLNRILLEQLRQLHLILKNNSIFPSSNTKIGSIQNGQDFPDDENATEEVDFNLPSDDNKVEESQNEATHLDSIICDSGNEINNQKNKIQMKNDRAHCPRIGPSCMRVRAGGAKVWTLSMVFLNVLFVQTFAPPAHLCNRGEFLDIEDA